MQSADYQINNVLESYATEKKIFVIGGKRLTIKTNILL